MFGYSVFREHVSDEDGCKVFGGAMDGGRNEYALLGEPVDNYKDGVESGGSWKRFDEIHRDGVPRTFGDRELFQQPIGLVSLGLRSHAGSTGLHIFLDKFSESGPSIVASDEVDGLVLAGVSGENVVVFISEHTEPKVVGIRDIDEVVVPEESIGGYYPIREWIL